VTASGLTDGVREFLLAFADDEHLMGQQHAEWIGVAPFLEEDLAFCSISQDELGHAASLYAIVAGGGDPTGVEDPAIDELAFHRDPADWRSCRLVEEPSGDWSHALVRHWLYDAAEELRWDLVSKSTLVPLAEVAVRATSEEWFHRRHADSLLDVLLVRSNSRKRLLAALDDLLPIAVGLFDPVPGEAEAVATGVATAPFDTCLPAWTERIRNRFGIDPSYTSPSSLNGRRDRSLAFAPLLERMREVFALDPTATW
jgi:ring-1,2-phenylacetyl-CoA epoxidase subunit PaaC